MGKNSKIEWCNHTHNFWVGCTKVSHACDYCYAETWAKRSGHPELWQGERRRTTATTWQKPLKWDRACDCGYRAKVFTNSLADFFDNQVLTRWRYDAWHLIERTPNLDWLILTKRPQNIRKMLPTEAIGCKPWGDGWPNVWLGVTCEDHDHYLQRYRFLDDIPAVVRFISYEPALGPLALYVKTSPMRAPDWLICGGESGKLARYMDPEWARNVRDECATIGTAFFMKQMTAKRTIPDDLMVRQFPRPRQHAAALSTSLFEESSHAKL